MGEEVALRALGSRTIHHGWDRCFGSGQGLQENIGASEYLSDLGGTVRIEHAPTNLHGRSLVPLLQNPDAAWDHPAVSQVSRGSSEPNPLMGYSVRTGCLTLAALPSRFGAGHGYKHDWQVI